MHSVLRLEFALHRGRTLLKQQYASGAMKVIRPFEVGEYALLQIASVTPGIHNGDHYELVVQVRGGAKVILLNQSATKLHGKRAGKAVHDIELHVEPDAHLEYYPGLTIPFADACYQQQTQVRLSAGARFGVLESWSAGRLERGEKWAFQGLSSKIHVQLENRPLFRDAFELSESPLEGLTDQHTLWASGFWHGLPALPAAFQNGPQLSGWGSTKAGSQYFRLLSSDTLEFQREMTAYIQQRWHTISGMQVPWSRYASGVFL
ncbi:urease accessory protein UreD [Deinococcus cellulosilyticus]|uniref:Urease accessory protein UreD n=1 Tax=Deinococcus cellulosilyticus (strain DSM 18568 / NBRC 106333 / KACC 11606 / 5516J-15) TaxID=1223518 RepID=A0A511MXJ9_DEIC1|nr:urease accessory protein UreD [Deinococcus cellulosilyticus]GEM44998.1 hypothetical protein DC3_06330 [Deinococcus cellulosilyticus NBRC 106333 = KACC 11606]